MKLVRSWRDHIRVIVPASCAQRCSFARNVAAEVSLWQHLCLIFWPGNEPHTSRFRENTFSFKQVANRF